jgi:hypothetical protein
MTISTTEHRGSGWVLFGICLRGPDGATTDPADPNAGERSGSRSRPRPGRVGSRPQRSSTTPRTPFPRGARLSPRSASEVNRRRTPFARRPQKRSRMREPLFGGPGPRQLASRNDSPGACRRRVHQPPTRARTIPSSGVPGRQSVATTPCQTQRSVCNQLSQHTRAELRRDTEKTRCLLRREHQARHLPEFTAYPMREGNA